MRILTILLAALLAVLPDCLACSLCGLEGGPCAVSAEACEEECGGGSGAGDDCTCDAGCTEADEAPAPTDAPSVAAAASAGPVLAFTAGSARALPAVRAAPRAAGPPTRLPLRI